MNFPAGSPFWLRLSALCLGASVVRCQNPSIRPSVVKVFFLFYISTGSLAMSSRLKSACWHCSLVRLLKMKQILPASLLLMLLVTACISPGDPMRKFVGQPSSLLEAKLGQPNERVRGRQGGEIWNYTVQKQWGRLEQENHAINGAYNTADKATTWNLSRPEVNTTVRSFCVSRDGIVYRYQSRQE